MNTRVLSLAACLVLVAGVAAAQTFTATLSADQVVPTAGPTDAQGFATVTINGTSISYNVLVSGVDGPTAAHIHEGMTGVSGDVAVDFSASFVEGVAFGTVDDVDSDTIADILSNPAGFYVQVHSTGFAGGAVRGQLSTGMAGETMRYFPVAAAISGQVGTFFRSDMRVVNRTSATANITVDYYAENSITGTPTATFADTVAPNEQLVLDNYVGTNFNITNGKGAVVVTSDRPVTAIQRTYNDKRGEGEGTFGNLVEGLTMDDAHTMGILPQLFNKPATTGEDYRSNIGWFNPGTDSVMVYFRAWDTDGTLVGEASRGVVAKLMQQTSVQGLFPSLGDQGDFYVTYESNGPVFVYATPVDNANGDAIHIPALPLH